MGKLTVNIPEETQSHERKHQNTRTSDLGGTV